MVGANALVGLVFFARLQPAAAGAQFAQGWTQLGSSAQDSPQSLVGSGACADVSKFPGIAGGAYCATGPGATCAPVIWAWSSGALRNSPGKPLQLLMFGGGHDGYGGDEIYGLDIATGPAAFHRISDPNAPGSCGCSTVTNLGQTLPVTDWPNSCVPAAGPPWGPNSRHSYGGVTYIPAGADASGTNPEELAIFSGAATTSSGGAICDVWLYDLSRAPSPAAWTRILDSSTFPGACDSGSQSMAFDPLTKALFIRSYSYFGIANPATAGNTLHLSTALGGDLAGQMYRPLVANIQPLTSYHNAAIDTVNRKYVLMEANSESDSTTMIREYDLTNPGQPAVYCTSPGYQCTGTGSQSAVGCPVNPSMNSLGPSTTFDSSLGKPVFYTPQNDNGIYVWDHATHSCIREAYPATAGSTTPSFIPGADSTRGSFGRFTYVPSGNYYIYVSDAELAPWVLCRNPAGCGTGSGVTSSVIPAYANNGSGCPINTVSGGPPDAVTNYNCPLPNPTGAGNLLVVWLRYQNTNNPSVTFTDNIGGNTYTLATACTDSAHNTVSAIYYVENVKPGVNRVTVNYSASAPFTQMQPYEFYNVATVGALDKAQCQTGTTSTVSPGTLPGLLASNDLIVDFGNNDNNTGIKSCAPTSQANISWTMRAALLAGPEPMCFQYGVYNSAASFSPAMTFSNSTANISVAAAFRAASEGTPPPSGIRVVYVQHDDGSSQGSTSANLQLPVSGNLIAEMTSAGCASNTLSSCPYPISLSDGKNSWQLVSGKQYLSNTGSSQETVGSIWYGKSAAPGNYALAISMHPCTGSCAPFPLSWIMYDIAGADTTAPLDLGFGGAGNGLASISNISSTSGPIATFTATPSAPNEVILGQAGYEWDTFTGLTAPTGAQFLSAFYNSETNYSWCDLNGGWGLYYNGTSTASETWTWSHDNSQQVGTGRGLAMGVAFAGAGGGIPPTGASPAKPLGFRWE